MQGSVDGISYLGGPRCQAGYVNKRPNAFTPGITATDTTQPASFKQGSRHATGAAYGMTPFPVSYYVLSTPGSRARAPGWKTWVRLLYLGQGDSPADAPRLCYAAWLTVSVQVQPPYQFSGRYASDCFRDIFTDHPETLTYTTSDHMSRIPGYYFSHEDREHCACEFCQVDREYIICAHEKRFNRKKEPILHHADKKFLEPFGWEAERAPILYGSEISLAFLRRASGGSCPCA